MAAVVVTERFRGVAVCTNTTRRNALETRAALWAAKEGASAPPTTQRVNAGKYGAGPTLLIGINFPDRATADAAWADIDGFDPTFLLEGTMLMQYTAREDGETVNETITIHRDEWPGGVRTVIV